MPGAGQLNEKVRLEARGLDDNGDALGDWAAMTRTPRSAMYTWLRGSEAVQEQRLQGVQPLIITVRADSVTRTVSNASRAVDARHGRVFNIKSATLTPDRAWVEILATWDGTNG